MAAEYPSTPTALGSYAVAPSARHVLHTLSRVGSLLQKQHRTRHHFEARFWLADDRALSEAAGCLGVSEDALHVTDDVRRPSYHYENDDGTGRS